jgi:GNAT superfamily N-acetyltransferase
MAFRTFDHLEVPLSDQALELYHQAFSHGRKPDAVIRSMFDKRMSFLHLETEGPIVTAMAISGIIPKAQLLLVDYLAVREDMRGRGAGQSFVGEILRWARDDRKLKGVILEAEAEKNPENEARIRFWQHCGFVLTDYVHQYIWVPEPYRAMYCPFDPGFRVSDNGESLFDYIGDFHKNAFRR